MAGKRKALLRDSRDQGLDVPLEVPFPSIILRLSAKTIQSDCLAFINSWGFKGRPQSQAGTEWGQQGGCSLGKPVRMDGGGAEGTGQRKYGINEGVREQEDRFMEHGSIPQGIAEIFREEKKTLPRVKQNGGLKSFWVPTNTVTTKGWEAW